MKIQSIKYPLGLLVATILLLSTMITPATAQWWRFGTDATEPVFTDLLFNQISVINADRSVQFSRDDLDSGEVVVRGRVEIGQGAVGRVEASLDGGTTWEEIEFNSRGLFAFKFSPELERTYRFRARALSTTGQMSDETANTFDFKVVQSDNRALAQEVFAELIRTYMARDRSSFMALVSRDFVGNEMALDSALSNDFRYFDSIRIRPTIQRMASIEDRWIIYFSFNRQVRSVRSGQMFQDQASTFLTLIRDGEGLKLYEMAAPLIFGLSDPSNIATFVTEESIGQEVIVVDGEGNVSKGEQKETVDSVASDIRQGAVLLNNHDPDEGFSLRTYSKAGIDPCIGSGFSFGVCTSSVSFGDEVQGMEVIGSGPIMSVKSVPEAPSGPLEDLDPPVGRLYALHLADGTYAVVRVAASNMKSTEGLAPGTVLLQSLQFEYRHQRNGTPRFD